jgi:hypothetical protein
MVAEIPMVIAGPIIRHVSQSQLIQGIARRDPILDVISEVIEIISRLCQRAHPKRDLKFGLYQFGVLPVADIYTND